jgi:hypothetical protein
MSFLLISIPVTSVTSVTPRHPPSSPVIPRHPPSSPVIPRHPPSPPASLVSLAFLTVIGLAVLGLGVTVAGTGWTD